MSPSHRPLSDAAPALDWDAVRATLKRHLTSRAGPSDRDALDDLVQEASIRFLRASRRDKVENMNALASTIAGRTWVDYIRRRTRWRRVFTENTEWEMIPMPGGSDWGDLRDRLQFIVLGLFEREKMDACGRLDAA